MSRLIYFSHANPILLAGLADLRWRPESPGPYFRPRSAQFCNSVQVTPNLCPRSYFVLSDKAGLFLFLWYKPEVKLFICS